MKKKTEEKAAAPAQTLTKDKGLQEALARLQGKYGDNSVSIGGVPPIEWIRTGLYPFDWITGGGLPRSRWVQIFGSKSAGKSSLCAYILGQAQKQGLRVGLSDAEHTHDPLRLSELGVNTESLVFNRPSTIEEAESMVMELCDHLDIILIDSIVAAAGTKELRGIEKDGIEKDSMMVIPANLSKFFRVVTPRLGKSRCSVVMVNQTRMNLGGYIAFEDFSGGHALRHANSYSIMMRQGPKDDAPKGEDGKTLIGQNVVLKSDKNKVGGQPAGTTTSFNLYYQAPFIRPVDELVTSAIERGVITRSGSKYLLGEATVAVGRDNVLPALTENKELMKALAEQMGVSVP